MHVAPAEHGEEAHASTRAHLPTPRGNNIRWDRLRTGRYRSSGRRRDPSTSREGRTLRSSRSIRPPLVLAPHARPPSVFTHATESPHPAVVRPSIRPRPRIRSQAL